MSHQPRFIEDESVQSVTFRTVGGVHLLRPSAAINALILGVLGRALSLYDVVLHAFVFMSNHGHLLGSGRNGQELSRFVGHVLGNIARGVSREIGWSGHVWGDRAKIRPVVDAGAQEERLGYILAHGAKEHLVASPLEWPGVTTARALVGEEELVGYWVDGRKAYEASRRKRPTDPSEYTTAYPIELAPLPAWARESRTELQRRCRDLIEDAEEKAARAEIPVLGVGAILASSPLDRSAEPDREKPVHFHCADDNERKIFEKRRKDFLAAHRACSAKRRQELDPDFPDRSFPVARRFVLHPPRRPAPPPGCTVPGPRAAHPVHGPAPPRPPPQRM